MKAFDIFKCVMSFIWMALILPVDAQTVPGEDPVTLNQKVMREMLPLNPVTPSATQNISQEIPSWLEAKVARLLAKAYSIDTTGIQTDENVVTTVTTNGLQKICTQDLASNTAAAATAGRYGPKTDPQIVVLRGDLVNICR
jgi:hypothetical protein